MLYAPFSDYHHAEHACYLCGRADHLVDTEKSIEGEGVLAICEGCVVDMVNVLTQHSETDVFSGATTRALEAEVKDLKRDKRELAKRLREYTAAPRRQAAEMSA